MQIKGKFESKRGEDHLVSHFGELIWVEEERRKGEKEEGEEEEQKGMELVNFCMEIMELVWIFVHLHGKIKP